MGIKAQTLRKRQAWLRERLLAGRVPSQVVSETMAKYGVSQRTAYRYMERALDEVREADKLYDGPELFMAQLSQLIMDARNDGNYGAAIRGMALRARIRGYDRPEARQVTLPPTTVAVVERVLGMTPAQRRERISELQAKAR